MQWAGFVTAEGKMGLAFYYGLPIILIGASACLGAVSLLFFTSGFEREQTTAAIWLPIAICAIGAIAYLISTSSSTSDFVKMYGSFIEWLWLWCALAFGVGVVFGFGARKRA